MKWFKKKKTTIENPKLKMESTLLAIENGISLLIDRKSVRNFYDSEWEIQIAKLEERFTCNITRFDDESAGNLKDIILSRPYAEITKDFVLGLDQKKEIFYD